MTFYIGQKVVCIDDSSNTFILKLHLRCWHHLKIGEVYTISGFDPEGVDAVYLIEIPELVISGWDFPVGWGVERFRPLVEKKTDISVFQQMLQKVPEVTA